MIRNNGRPAGNRAAKKSISGGFNSHTSLPPGTNSRDQRSPLCRALDAAIAEANGSKLSMKDLTVLAVQSDPFRTDADLEPVVGLGWFNADVRIETTDFDLPPIPPVPEAE